MRRILHIVVDLEAGGAERALVNLIAATQERDLSHYVLCMRHPGFFEEEVRRLGATLTVLGEETPSSRFTLFRLRQVVREVRPDVVQGWMYYANLAAQFAMAGRAPRSRPRLIWGVRCSDLDFSAYSSKLGAAVKVGALTSGRVDLIVANSHAGRTAHAALGYDPQRLVVVENGFDLSAFRPRPERRTATRRALGLPDDAFLAVTVARVDPMKGYDILTETATRAPAVRFLAVGKGTDALQGPENFRGLGRRSDVADLLNAADLLVSSSRYGEGMSNSIGEAMATGIPVVATDCGDAERMLVGGADALPPAGLIAPVGRADALADAIDAVRKNQAEAARLGAAGRCRAEQRYSASANADAWRRCYGAVLDGQGNA